MWAQMGSGSLKTFILVSAVGAIVLVATLMLTGIIGDQRNVDEVVLVVDYFDSWNMTLSENGYVKSLSGFGRMERVLMRPTYGIWTINMRVYKLDGSEGYMKVRIRLRDGTVLQEASTSAPYGTVDISIDIQ
jgi:hypothetical protein